MERYARLVRLSHRLLYSQRDSCILLCKDWGCWCLPLHNYHSEKPLQNYSTLLLPKLRIGKTVNFSYKRNSPHSLCQFEWLCSQADN